MGYKGNVEEQRKFDYDYFRGKVEFIESQFKDDVLKYISGRYIYVLLDGMYDCTYFVKTTVSDIRAVCGKISFDFIANLDGYTNIVLYSLREPNKKSFRGKIKYTPNGTISLTTRFIAPDDGGRMKCVGLDNMPILQDEKFIVSSCDNLFNCEEEGADYDFIERHAFRFLTDDKRIRCGEDWVRRQPEAALDDSQLIHRALCVYYDLSESWGVCYYYAGNCFIFPLNREYIQDLFKKRDKENGRRRVIASLVNGYTRKDGTEVDGHLRTANTFTIDGREYSIFVGAEDFEKMYPNTDKSKARLRKIMEKGTVDKGFLHYE